MHRSSHRQRLPGRHGRPRLQRAHGMRRRQAQRAHGARRGEGTRGPRRPPVLDPVVDLQRPRLLLPEAHVPRRQCLLRLLWSPSKHVVRRPAPDQIVDDDEHDNRDRANDVTAGDVAHPHDSLVAKAVNHVLVVPGKEATSGPVSDPVDGSKDVLLHEAAQAGVDVVACLLHGKVQAVEDALDPLVEVAGVLLELGQVTGPRLQRHGSVRLRAIVDPSRAFVGHPQGITGRSAGVTGVFEQVALVGACGTDLSLQLHQRVAGHTGPAAVRARDVGADDGPGAVGAVDFNAEVPQPRHEVRNSCDRLP
mmetsp:Transcript_40106/g.126855  ORF Transcript_40106/g.126855 Transcript_40106/m.126855 type:complete len:307 (-) Transcript_40106:1891-2811(-)